MTFASVLLMCFVAVVFLGVGLLLGWLCFGGPAQLGTVFLDHVKAELESQAANFLKDRAANFVSRPADSSAAPPAS